jgi:hypothetical protein
VEQHDPQGAHRDLAQPPVEGLDLGGGLGVHLAQQRLAEVGDVRAREAAHEPLRPRDSHLDVLEAEDGRAAVEHGDPGGAQRLDHLLRAVGVPVVVAQHRDHRHLQRGAGIGQDRGLLGLAVRGEVAGQEDRVDIGGDACEGGLDLLTAALAAMEVGGGRDSHAEIPFALGGSLACWARGGPEVTNDLDLIVRPQDADAAVEALAAAGMRPERPPEEWLYKAWDGDVMLDLIFELVDGRVTDRTLERAEELTVASVTMPVMRLEDVLVTRLLSLDEHGLDLGPLLAISRALREQVDWAEVRTRSAHSPYARAFFTLLEGLGIVGQDEPADPDAVMVRPDMEATPRGATAFGPSSRDPR